MRLPFRKDEQQMTINEIITAVKRRTPNQYTEADMLRWLSRAENLIFKEIYQTHEDAPIQSFDGYTESTPQDTVLLATEPYDEMYLHYLNAQIHLANAEINKYNNEITLFNTVFLAYRNDWNKTRLPKQGVTEFKVM